MRLTIITINYNGSGDTIRLLESLGYQSDKDFGIIVVDNKSAPEDMQALKNFVEAHNNNFISLKLINSTENLGFSGGNNLGISRALSEGAKWVLLLNNDTWVEKTFVTCLKAKLSATDADVAGIPLNESGQTAYCGKISWLKPTLKHIYDASAVSHFALYTYYVIGGGMAINKQVFEKIGFLDEKYFLYFEDADFSVNAVKAGFKIKILDNTEIHHAVSSSTHKLGSPLLLKYHYRNALYFNLKNGPWYIKIIVWPWSWIIIAKQVFKLIIGRHPAQSNAILSSVWDFYFGRVGKINP